MNGAARILVVDDEPQVLRSLRSGLSARGYAIETATDGASALIAAADTAPDLIVLDLGLPDLDGVEVCRRLRDWSSLPIIVLSARERESDKIAALDAGADDYLTKPFGMGELLARVRAALRRTAVAVGEQPVFRSGDLIIDLARRRVERGGHEIHLTPKEYDLLKHLARHAGKVITQRQLLQVVWGPEYGDEGHYLRVHMSALRRKLEPEPARPRYLITEPGVGYRLQHDPESAQGDDQ
jgi:two-component system KDP operon response regulator KdpE